MPSGIKNKKPSPPQSIVTADSKPVIPYTETKMLIPVNAKYARIPDVELEQFLSFKSDGHSDAKAASLIGVNLRAIQYWLEEDLRFRDAYVDALYHAVDSNEDRMMDLCRSGNVSALKSWLEAYRPERWGKVQTKIESSGTHINTLNILSLAEEKQRIIDEMPTLTIEDAND